MTARIYTFPVNPKHAQGEDLIDSTEIFTYPETDEQVDELHARWDDLNRDIDAAIAYAIYSLRMVERKRREAQRRIVEHKKRIKRNKDPA